MQWKMTEGSVWKKRGHVFPAAPIIFSRTLYGLADLLIIGQFEGAAGTTAVSVI